MSSAFERLHPGIQQALWDMRWKELRPLQVRAIHEFFTSVEPLILSASTASGKTEAAFLPVLSAVAGLPEGSVRAMYVGPLKALINDQFLRLEDLCRHADIPVHRWHGDVTAAAKQRFRQSPGGVLLITPESLESAFINYGTQVPRIFGGLQHVVIDELHSFVADVRGVHLKSLIARISQVIGHQPRMLGLSATLADFDSARAFLDHHHPERVKIIDDDEGSRSIRIGVRAFPRPRPAPTKDDEELKQVPRLATTALEACQDLVAIAEGTQRWEPIGEPINDETALRNLALDLASVFRSHANLIFTNSRGLGEMLADELNHIADEQRWHRNPFLLHHGSLSKEVREDVEHRLKSKEALSVFCTSTLEMGIDIGSVHSVGQLAPPWSVASLVQRLGRSGRREGESSILRLYSLDPPPGPDSKMEELFCPQLLRSIALVELMLERWLEPFDNDPFHFSTLVHQILSLLRQTGGTTAEKIHETLIANGAFHSVTPRQLGAILRTLATNRLIEQMPTGELILAPNGEDLTHGKDFYAAFAGSADYSIRHGQVILGKLPVESVPSEGEHLLLNGRRWMVVIIDSRSMIVEVAPAKGRKKPVFLGTGGTIHRKIVEQMRGVLAGSDVPAYLHQDAAKLLDAARIYAAKAGLFEKPWLSTAGRCLVFPWTGTKGMEALKLCAELDGIAFDAGNLSIQYRTDEESLRQHFARVAARRFEPFALAAIMKSRHKEKYDDLLPEDLLDLSNSQRTLSVEDAAQAAAETLGRFINPSSLISSKDTSYLA
ncbi:ATP-dependent Lhr-like helicase [Haloferula luteola]|uniref:ATP-dependent Lhr-like helicase n=1 Tax=Haloferula luteola TaxID=595692 RepID=A0A840V0T2_9BACT|nr:DEAD/DEAH box helicase [Haloferula luteola]MBB5350676.1 ATP-dependent Lhr-like helicase [Haloferula luteola]